MTATKPVPGERCIMCGQVVPPKGRICGRCSLPILKHHKYHFEGSVVCHDDCEHPEVSK